MRSACSSDTENPVSVMPKGSNTRSRRNSSNGRPDNRSTRWPQTSVATL